MHFKLSRASSNFAPSVRHPASVLAFILNLYARDRQSEDIVLGRDLDSVRHVIADGLVVFHPGCSQASQFHFSSARKDCIFSSYEQKKKIRRISENFSLVFLRSQSWPWTCLVKAKAMMMMFQSFALFLGSLEKKTGKKIAILLISSCVKLGLLQIKTTMERYSPETCHLQNSAFLFIFYAFSRIQMIQYVIYILDK